MLDAFGKLMAWFGEDPNRWWQALVVLVVVGVIIALGYYLVTHGLAGWYTIVAAIPFGGCGLVLILLFLTILVFVLPYIGQWIGWIGTSLAQMKL